MGLTGKIDNLSGQNFALVNFNFQNKGVFGLFTLTIIEQTSYGNAASFASEGRLAMHFPESIDCRGFARAFESTSEIGNLQ